MEYLFQNITSGVRKQMSSVCDSVKSMNLYLEEHDLQTEFGRRIKRMRLNGNYWRARRHVIKQRVLCTPSTGNPVSQRLASLVLMNATGMPYNCPTSTCTSKLSNYSDDDGSLSVSERSTTGASSSNSNHINQMTNLFSPVRYSNDDSDSSATTNSKMSGPESPIDKEGKIFISTEYSSNEKLLIVFATQCGNLEKHGHCRKLRLCFRQVKDAKTFAKEIRKIERSSVCEDFRYNHVYSIPFETFNEMQKSGVTVQIQLKSTNNFGRTKELCSTQVSVQDVEKDPVWRSDKLFI